MHKAAVLLSTYNGERYLREQLDSILAQTGVELTLYIRDDGSSDRTLEIIEEYQKEHSCIVFSGGDNLGVGNSFMQLVYDAPDDFDYYSFSDQDDIWLENKLIKAIETIKDRKGPALYTSNQLLVDGRGNEIAMRHRFSPCTSYMQILCNNLLSGCTMVWNHPLQTILKDEKRRPSRMLLEKRIHDVWVAMIAAVTGEIVFDPDAYIMYRQHENNVVGVRKTGLLSEWKKKLQRPELRNGRSSLAKEVMSADEDLISDERTAARLKRYSSCNEKLRARMEVLKEARFISGYSGEPVTHVAAKIMTGLF